MKKKIRNVHHSEVRWLSTASPSQSVVRRDISIYWGVWEIGKSAA